VEAPVEATDGSNLQETVVLEGLIPCDVVEITPVDAVRGWGAATIADFHEPHRDSG